MALDRLEKKGLLRSTRGDADGDREGRPKRYLDVTREGREALAQARSSLLASWKGLEQILEEWRP